MTTDKGEAFDNVWDALCDTPEEAANMTARSELMSALRQRVLAWRVTQAEAARRLGVTQPRLSDLLRGHIDRFSLDALVNLLPAAGLSMRMELRAA